MLRTTITRYGQRLSSLADWKTDLKILADKLRTEQKNKKGFQSKFQNVVGYKGKLGFNDTGVPLTAKAAKSLEKNRAAYTGRRSSSRQ